MSEKKSPFELLSRKTAGVAKVAGQAASAAGGAASEAASVAGSKMLGAAKIAGNAAADAAHAAGDALSHAAESAAKTAAGKARTTKTDLDKPPVERIAPNPLYDDQEISELDDIEMEIEKLKGPDMLQKMGDAASALIPNSAKQIAGKAIYFAQSQDVYKKALEVAMHGYDQMAERAKKLSVSPDSVIATVNQTLPDRRIASLDEMCLLRSYEVARAARSYRIQHLGLAAIEGAATGAPGLPGIPFNLVLSTFLFYRAVQSVALTYGYDVKRDPSEMIIEGEVFVKSLNPDENTDGMSNVIAKIMALGQTNAIKQALKSGWKGMAQAGGAPLLMAQLRALANGAARNALGGVGAKSIEGSVFAGVFKQIGSKLSQKAVEKAIPVIGGAIGAAFDTAQMHAILQYADLFYHKHFILEKERRVATLLGEKTYETSEA